MAIVAGVVLFDPAVYTQHILQHAIQVSARAASRGRLRYLWRFQILRDCGSTGKLISSTWLRGHPKVRPMTPQFGY